MVHIPAWTLTKQAQNKLFFASSQNKMERSMFSITHRRKQGPTSGSGDDKSHIISNVRKMKWSWAGHINCLKDDRWTSRHLETIRQENTTRKISKAAMRRPGQTLEGHALAKDNTRLEANLKAASCGRYLTTGHYGCPMMVAMMTMVVHNILILSPLT